MVIANGCPRSGTHAMMELFQALGLKRAPGIVKAIDDKDTIVVNATPADPKPVSAEQVLDGEPGWFIHGHLQPVRDYGNAIPFTVIRDPRNVLCSYQRLMERQRGQRPPLKEAVDNFLGVPFFGIYMDFLDWREREPSIHYEELSRKRWGSVYEDAAEDRSTWNDRPSNWRTDWTPLEKRQWRRMNGPELAAAAGYA